MTAKEPTTQEVVFKPRARLVDTIGADLIKDEMAGIIELVKNAYDADATKVKIRFNDLTDSEKASIVVEDDGHGMTLKTILEHWLSPSTDDKGKRKTSPGKRPLLGRKGIGRFAAMRLGHKLVLKTTPQDVKERYRLDVKWDEFLDGSHYLDEIKLPLQISHDVVEATQGTQLRISKLQDTWDKNRLARLCRELKLLLSPLTEEGFTIRLDLTNSGLESETISRYSRKIEPYEIPDITDYILEAQIEKDGSYKYEYRRLVYLDDREEVIKRGEGKNILQRFPEDFPPDGSPFDPDHGGTGPFKIRFNIWDRDPELLIAKGSRLPEAHEMGVRAIGRLLDEVSGVAIYRDGFRVRPYGDPRQDWLDLGQRRVQSPVVRIGPNQLRGIIDISGVKNPHLEDKSSREGLKENEAYKALWFSVIAIISLVEPLRHRFRQRQGLGKPPPTSTRAIIEKRKTAFTDLRESVTNVVKDAELRKKIHSYANIAEKISDEEQERLLMQAEILHDNHALGILARFILHEGLNSYGYLDAALSNLEWQAKNGRKAVPGKLVIEKEDLTQFNTSLTSARDNTAEIGKLFAQLDPLTRPRRRKRPKIVVENVVSKVVSILTPGLRKAGVEIELPGKGVHQAMAWEADLFHAMFNLIDNGIYWVQQTSGQRKIKIEIKTIKKDGIRDEGKCLVEILVSDTGPGVPKESASDIFKLGYSEKPDGTGVGLFIARESVERSKGTIELVNQEERGATFKILLDGA